MLDQALRSLVGDGLLVYLVTADHIWAHAMGSEQWTEIWEPLVNQSRQARRRLATGRTMTIVGATAGAGGVVLGALSYTQGKSSAEVAERASHTAPTREEFESGSFAEVESARRRYQASWVIGGAGLAVASVGVLVARVGDTEIVPQAYLHGGGLFIRMAW
jgi:DNA-binding transcriptional regulator YdaS (Cro superfamily)